MKKRLELTPFIIFISISMLVAFLMGYGNDYYWHVKAGEYIVNNLKIPFHDVFSWYGIANNLYWMSHEWLSEVVIYLYKYIFGYYGPFIFCFANYGILVVLLYLFNQEKLQKNKGFIIIWAAIMFGIFANVMLPRPHMISYILLAITLYLLFDNYNNDSKKIYWLPLISLLWVNFHGGSSNLPYLLAFIFAIVSLLKFKYGKIISERLSKKQIYRYLIVGVLSVFALVINPHGIKMISYPYVNMADSYMLDTILEWHSPTLNSSGDYIIFVAVILVGLILISTKKKIRFIDLCIIGIFILLGLKSLKFPPFICISGSFIIPNYIDDFDFPFSKFNIALFIILIGAGAGVLFSGLSRSYSKLPISEDITDYIKEKSPERLYNPYNYGGYLIYKDIKVFIDGRADMYSGNIFKDAIDIEKYGYISLVDYYDFDMILIYKSSPLVRNIDNQKYTYVKEDENLILYEKVK